MNGFDTGAEAPQHPHPACDAVYAEAEGCLPPAPKEFFPAPTPWFRLASGIEAGIVGGLAMLALQLSQSLWDGHVWWEVPNLLGSTFYGPRAFRAGAGMATVAGMALHFVITGCLGALFGLAFAQIQQRGRLVMLGLAASVGWYTLANAAFWPKVNPWVPVASPRPGTVVSHVLLGACLGFMGQRGFIGQRPGVWIPSAQMPALKSAGFVSPDEMPLSNAEIAAAGAAMAPDGAENPAAGAGSEANVAEIAAAKAETGSAGAPVGESLDLELGQSPAVTSSDALE